MIFLFLQCVSTVIIVYIIISPLNSYLYIHWILEILLLLYYYYMSHFGVRLASLFTLICIQKVV